VEIGLVPFGSIGLTLFGVDLWVAAEMHALHGVQTLAEFAGDPSHWRMLADLFLIGLFGGFYIVPLYALVQSRSDPEHRSRIIAGNNILNALFMVAAAALAIGLFAAGLTIPQLILVTALLNAAVAVYIYLLVPEFLMRFIVWMLVHSVYRLEKSGLITSRFGDATAVRGGRRKKIYRLTKEGLAALHSYKRISDDLWDGLIKSVT